MIVSNTVSDISTGHRFIAMLSTGSEVGGAGVHECPGHVEVLA